MHKKAKIRKRFVEAEDICRLHLIRSAAISPDEKKIAYTVEVVSDNKRKYYSHIFAADIGSRTSRQYTFGEVSDREPTWSPDGKSVAFISTRNKRTGIYVIPIEGGAERKVIEKDGSLANLNWTPDGKELVFQFRYNDSHWENDEKKKSEPPVYRHITRLFYRFDGAGWLPRDRFHIWKVDVESGSCRQLTRGKYDEMSPAVSPNGKWIAFVSNRTKDPDVDSEREDIFIMSINGGRQKRVPTPAGPIFSPSFSPDGSRIAYLGHTHPEDVGVVNYHLWVVGITGKPAAKDLTPRFDRQLYDQTIGDMGEGFAAPVPRWSVDGRRIYFIASDNGSTHVFYVPTKGGLPTRVTKRNCHVKAASLNGRRTKIALVVSELKSPGQLCLIPARYNGDSQARVLTDLNAELFSHIAFPAVREVWFKAYDGTDLQGWLVTPPGMKKNRRYPGILEIHGGPRVQYGFTFFHEMLYLASCGYVVFYTNPRGGGGRGETFAGAISHDWGSIDYQDCMAAADYLERLPYVDRRRLGVTGGSYGGYMTNWIVGHTDRFRAAVTQRSVVDLRSFVGTSDTGHHLAREFGGYPWKNPEVYVRCSPLTYAKNIKTPLLILHNERDFRANIEQAEQLFATLKLMKKRVEMVRFPEEPHGLSRHGRPDRRIARLEWIRKWFDRYLK